MCSLPGGTTARAVRYDVKAMSSPGLISVVLAPFARRGLMLDVLQARRDGELTLIEITVNEMPYELLPGCEAALRQVIGIVQVEVVPAS